MERMRKEYYKDKEIIIINYSNCKEAEMIRIIDEAKYLIQKENKEVLLLSIFNSRNFITPGFVRHFEKEVRGEVEHLIRRNAVVGLSEIQKWILKAVNLWYKRQIYNFGSKDLALEFLVSDE